MCRWLSVNEWAGGVKCIVTPVDLRNNCYCRFIALLSTLLGCFGIRMLWSYWNICQSNCVEPFSIFFPPSIKFCFTSKMLKILDTSFYNVDLVSHQLRDTAGSYCNDLFRGHVGGESGLRTKATTMNGWWTCGKRVSSLVYMERC